MPFILKCQFPGCRSFSNSADRDCQKDFHFFFFFALTTSHHTQLLVYITGFYISTETQAPHNLPVNRVCALTSKTQSFFFFFFGPRNSYKLFSVGCVYWHMLLPVMWKRVLRVDKVFAPRWRRRRGVTLTPFHLNSDKFAFFFQVPAPRQTTCLAASQSRRDIVQLPVYCRRLPPHASHRHVCLSLSLSPACLQKRPIEMPFFFFLR